MRDLNIKAPSREGRQNQAISNEATQRVGKRAPQRPARQDHEHGCARRRASRNGRQGVLERELEGIPVYRGIEHPGAAHAQ